MNNLFRTIFRISFPCLSDSRRPVFFIHSRNRTGMTSVSSASGNRDRPLAVTMGDPAGVGPDVISDLLEGEEDLPGPLLVIGDHHVLDHLTNDPLGAKSDLRVMESLDSSFPGPARIFLYDPVEEPFPLSERGSGSERSGRHALAYIRESFSLWKENRIGGIVTGPVSKKWVSRTQPGFQGHTKWFADRFSTGAPVMGMVRKGWRVAVVTRHLPLKNVHDALTGDRIAGTIRRVHRDLQERFNIEDPVIGVCGMNPHAGEGGRLGSIEQEIIEPVIAELCRDGYDVSGPVSAESLMTEHGFTHHDFVIAMFHDQGLVPLKARGPHACAAVTMGLPLVRTSVAHGTGYELAGTDRVRSESMRHALSLAARFLSAGKEDRERAS